MFVWSDSCRLEINEDSEVFVGRNVPGHYCKHTQAQAGGFCSRFQGTNRQARNQEKTYDNGNLGKPLKGTHGKGQETNKKKLYPGKFSNGVLA